MTAPMLKDDPVAQPAPGGRTVRTLLVAVAALGFAAAAGAVVASAVAVRGVRAEQVEVRGAVAAKRAECAATERVLGDLRADAASTLAEGALLEAGAERDRAERTAIPRSSGPAAPALRSPKDRRDRAVQLLKNVVGKVAGLGAARTPQGRALVAALIAEYEAGARPEASCPEVDGVLAEFAKRQDLPDELARLLGRAAQASRKAASAAEGSPGEAGGADRRREIDALVQLARSLAEVGDLEKAMARSDEALSIAREQPEAKRTVAVVEVLTLRAAMLADAGRDAEAAPALREAYELRRSTGKKPTSASSVGVKLARTLLRLDRPAEAEPILKAVVDAEAAAGSEFDSTDYFAARVVHATALRKLDREREAKRIEAGVREHVSYLRDAYGGCNSPEYAEYAVARGRIDLAEQTLWHDVELGVEMKDPKRIRDAVENIVEMLEEAGSDADGRLAMYRRWLARTAAAR